MTENEQKAVQLVAEADKKLNSKGKSFAIDTIFSRIPSFGPEEKLSGVTIRIRHQIGSLTRLENKPIIRSDPATKRSFFSRYRSSSEVLKLKSEKHLK